MVGSMESEGGEKGEYSEKRSGVGGSGNSGVRGREEEVGRGGRMMGYSEEGLLLSLVLLSLLLRIC
jgi:hypothetical protein